MLFDEFKDEALVRPSIPIAYFGDTGAYSRSPERILTVGLNPSRLEFPRQEPSRRFPDARLDVEPDAARAPAVHRRALDSYFRHTPYLAWFRSYESVLNGAGASYLPGAKSIAIHTDICSPLATDPTWNGLTNSQQAALEAGGAELWHDLVRCLRPHMIVASVAARHLGKLSFHREDSDSVLIKIERDRPFMVHRRWLRIGDARCLLVFGRPVNLPFGSVARTDRMRIGAAAAEAAAGG